MRIGDTGRALHGKLRPSSVRHITNDESLVGTMSDRVTSRVLTQVAGAGYPVVPSPTGTARRSQGVSLFQEATIDADLIAAVQGDMTVTCLVRTNNTDSNYHALFSVGGTIASEVAAENIQCQVGLFGGNTPYWLHEYSAGTDVTFQPTNYTLQRGVWTHLCWRKSAVSGVGPGGTCTLELFVNGQKVALPGGAISAVNCSDGGNSILRVLGDTGRLANNIDLDGVYLWRQALSEEEIMEDVRRLILLTHFPRIDTKVLVENAVGQWQNVNEFNGIDWVERAEYTTENDQPCATANISLLREVENLSLAGLKTDAKANLTDLGDPTAYGPFLNPSRGVEILAARVPLGIRAGGSDFQSVFRGTVDDIDEGQAETVTLHCRDQGGRLIQTYVEETVRYGSDSGPVAVQGEMQYILNDNDNDSGNDSVGGLVARTGSYSPLTLNTPTNPNWAIKRFAQRREPVLAALRTLAGQIAWECRYQFNSQVTVKDWELQFFDPRRNKEEADGVMTPDDILDITQLSRSVLGIRNVVRVTYPSSETTLPAVPTVIDGVTLSPNYLVRRGWNNVDGEGGRMTAWIEIESVQSIAQHGRQFMEIAEASCSQLDTIQEAGRMAFGAVQDLEFANLDQSIAVPCSFEVELNDMLKLGSNPKLHTAAQRLAVRSITHTLDEKATTAIQLRGKPSIGFKRWLRIETRAGNGRPGVQRPQDANADVYMGTLLQAMRNMLDRTNAFKGGKFLQVRNPEFQAFTNGLANPPDGWTVSSGAWGTDVDVESANQLSGGKAVKILTASGRLTSDPIPISGSRFVPYSLEGRWLRTSINQGTNNCTLGSPTANTAGTLGTFSSSSGATVLLTATSGTPFTSDMLGTYVSTASSATPANTGVWQITGYTSTTVVTLTRVDGVSFVNEATAITWTVYSCVRFTAPSSIFTADSVGGNVIIPSASNAANVGTWRIVYYVSGAVVKLMKTSGSNFVTESSAAITWIAPVALRMDVQFLNANKVAVAGGSYSMLPDPQALPGFGVVGMDATINSWFSSRGDGVAPPDAGTARWVQLTLRHCGAFAPLVLDDVSAYKTGLDLRTFVVSLAVSYTYTAAGWYPAQFPAPAYPSSNGVVVQRWDYGVCSFATASSGTARFGQVVAGDVTLPNWAGWGFYAREDGTYLVTSIVTVQATNSGQWSQLRFVVNATYNNSGATVTTNAAGQVIAQGPRHDISGGASDFGNSQIATDRAAIMMLTSRIRLKKGDRVTCEFYRSATTVSYTPTSSALGEINLFVVKQELAE